MGLANVAATFMEHLCTCDKHGYSQAQRWGDASLGSDIVECEGHTGEFYWGDRDCSSAVIDSWQTALQGTEYEGLLGDATYTGNMRRVFVGSGLFQWMPMSYSAQRGDIYLNEQCHTAMCIDGSASNDILGEFSQSETYGITGQSGDQTGWESSIHAYYDYPWDGILHFVGADAAVTQAPAAKAEAVSGDVTDLARRAIAGEFGNGESRRNALGARYAEVQAEVNRLLKGGDTTASAATDIDNLARRAINGEFGNGQARKDALGDKYDAVQARVNEMLA